MRLTHQLVCSLYTSKKEVTFALSLLILLIPLVTLAAPTKTPPSSSSASVKSPGFTTMSVGGGGAQPVPVSEREGVSIGSVFDPTNGSQPGAFTYQYPFSLFLGRSGVPLDLSLSYSSGNLTDTGFGYGWSLSIPYIQRYNKTGLNNLYSTTTPSNTFYSSLSGELATTTTSGLFLARNDDGSNLQYSFTSNVWTVIDKAGTTYVFGTASTSRQDDVTGTQIFKWLLQQQTDANGNSITYTYTKDLGQIYPSVITYTNSASSTGLFTANFTLGLQATSTATSSVTGFPVKTRYQVTQVTSKLATITRRTYALAYGVGDNSNRTVLKSITETGQNPGTITLPATTFNYSTSTSAMATSTWNNPVGNFVENGQDKGVVVTDVNGDGLSDLVQSWEYIGYSTLRGVYLNTGSGWATTSTASFTSSLACDFALFTNHPQDGGGRMVDVNGDGLPDLICSSNAYINNGTSWVASSTWNTPVSMVYNDSIGDPVDKGVRFGDINGDGLVDLLYADSEYDSGTNISTRTQEVYLNTGSGWVRDYTWSIPTDSGGQPVIFTNDFGKAGGGILVDINGDGLADILQGQDANYIIHNQAYINNGHGWTSDPIWILPGSLQAQQPGMMISDLNGDGLPDVSTAIGNLPYTNNSSSFYWTTNAAYLNTGSGWKQDLSRSIPLPYFISNPDYYGDAGPRTGNIQGSGLADLMVSSFITIYNYGGLQFAQGDKPDLLNHVTDSLGKQLSPTYQSTSKLRDDSNNLLNPKLASYFPAVTQIQTYDGVAATTTDTYQYKDGTLYFGNPLDRRFGGFGSITKTDAVGNKTSTYYHTGNGTATSTGEYADAQSKIGKVYRVENYDSGTTLFKVLITKWDGFVRGLSNFIWPVRSTEMDYDGLGSHKDLSQEFTFSTSTGDMLQQISWGQVTASNDGSFTDTGTDKRIVDLTYAASSTLPVSKVARKKTTDQSGNVLSDTKYLYDLLSLGSISKGNLTEQDDLKIGTTTFIQTVRNTYNAYGQITQTLDPRGATTSIVYDAQSLYPATTTDPLGRVTTYVYNVFIGKPSMTKDPNGVITNILLDALNRVIGILKPDPVSTTTQATTTAYIYNDSTFPRSVQEITYLNSATTTNKYSYKDGYDRVIEERTQAEPTNTYSVKDTYYNGLSLVTSQSLPFFASSTSYTGISAPPASALLTTYTYDPLQRSLTINNAVGTTRNTYGNWQVTTTDPNGNPKDLFKDAYGNLTSVVEHSGSSNGTTQYAYNGNNNLTQITDAAGNVRNFTYDLLGKRLTAQDLHATVDGTYGTWSYVYDDSGNLTQQTDPKSQVVSYTYDVLNRPLTEDFTGFPGTEVMYVYDSCLYGIGHLCSATTPVSSATTTYAYDLLGNTAQETEKILGTTYTTARTFDRQGNTASITYPDNSQVLYTYNKAGLLEAINQKASGAGAYTGIVTNFDYSPAGQIAFKQFGNGVTTTNTYDAAHLYRLSRIQTVSSSGFGTLMMSPPDSGMSKASLAPAASEAATSSPLSLKAINDRIILALNDDPGYNAVQYPADSADSSTPETTLDLPLDESATSPEVTTTPPETPDASTTDATRSDIEPSIPIVIPNLDLPDANTILLGTTTQSDLSATSTSKLQRTFADELKSLSDTDSRLALKAPVISILGERALDNGLMKYAYRTNISVESIPASEGTIQEARKGGLELGAEVVGKRTSTTRTFSTNDPTVFIAEINAGDPKYYKDNNGAWWIAQYGITTQSAYVAQMKPAPQSFIEKLISFIVPQRALASVSTFYPGTGAGAYGADGNMYFDYSTDWSYTRNTSTSDNSDYTSPSMGANAKYGTGYGSNYYGITRAIMGFDTRALTSSTVITSASVNLYITIHTQSGSENRIFLTSATPLHDTYVDVFDYGMLGSTAFASSTGSYTSYAYNSLPLNAAGIANIVTDNTRPTYFGVRTYNDLYDVPPTAATTYDTNWASAESGTSTAPQLVVTYTVTPTTPNALQTDGQTNPTTIGDHTPAFTAFFNDTDPGDYAAKYQVQVSTSSTVWTSPFWDSAEHVVTESTTNGMRSPDVVYGGSAMNASTPYYWRIRFRDSFNNLGPWSTETASFSLAPWYNPSAPTNLLVNGTTSPMTLSTSTIAFTATYNNTIATDTASSYQIQVTNSGAGWVSPTWDSSKTTLSSSTPSGMQILPVAYSGQTLVPGNSYDWRIRFWNSENSVGVWSTTTASFAISSSFATADLQDIFYTYDPNGNILQINDLSGTNAAKVERFTYDGLNRLLTASTTAASTLPFLQTYTYDMLGNFTNKSDVGSYTYAGTGNANPHAPTTAGATSLTYDNNGNLTNLGSTTYQWDYRNRIKGVITAATTTGISYDYLSQRIRTAVAGVTTYYPNNLYNISGTTTTDHIFDTQGNPVATYLFSSSTPTYTYLHVDNLGSTNVTTNSLGHLNETSDYYPYGAPRIDTGSPLEQRKYIGQYFDAGSGLNYLNARYQDPVRGQFLSEDPVFLGDPSKQSLINPQSLNSYSYANNNPIVNKDPSGLLALGFGFNGTAGTPGLFGGSSIYGVLTINPNPFSVQVGIVSSGEGGGSTAIGGIGGTAGVLFSNARSISELEGADALVGGSVRAGADLGVDIGLSGSGNSNRTIVTVNPNVGVGLTATPYALPAELHGGAGYSKSLVQKNITSAITSAIGSAKTSAQSQLNSISSQIKQLQQGLSGQKTNNSKKNN